MRHKRKSEIGVPVLRGFISNNGKIINVFCPYCDKYHIHGWDSENPSWAIEHRVAHCFDRNGLQYTQGTPLSKSGYYIGVMKLPEEKSVEIFPNKTKRKAKP